MSVGDGLGSVGNAQRSGEGERGSDRDGGGSVEVGRGSVGGGPFGIMT